MSILAKIRDKKLQGGVIYDPPPARIGLSGFTLYVKLIYLLCICFKKISERILVQKRHKIYPCTKCIIESKQNYDVKSNYLSYRQKYNLSQNDRF